MFPIVSTTASLLSILFFALTVRVILYRRSQLIAIGDNNDLELRRRMRVQSNFCETVPLILFLLLLCEINKAPWPMLIFLNTLLILGRCLHAFGVSQSKERFIWRVCGMIGTFIALGGSTLLLMWCIWITSLI